MTPQIRPAEPGDVPALRVMMAGSNGYEPGPQREMIEAYAAGWELKPGAEVWVLRDAEGVAGFYALIPWGEGDRELDLFFTADDRQGRGCGRMLYEHMISAARSLGASRLKIVPTRRRRPSTRAWAPGPWAWTRPDQGFPGPGRASKWT